jgi:hypothetical protein
MACTHCATHCLSVDGMKLSVIVKEGEYLEQRHAQPSKQLGHL